MWTKQWYKHICERSERLFDNKQWLVLLFMYVGVCVLYIFKSTYLLEMHITEVFFF